MTTVGVRETVDTVRDGPDELVPRVTSVVTSMTVKEPPDPIGIVSVSVASETRIVSGPVAAGVIADSTIVSVWAGPPDGAPEEPVNPP